MDSKKDIVVFTFASGGGTPSPNVPSSNFDQTRWLYLMSSDLPYPFPSRCPRSARFNRYCFSVRYRGVRRELKDIKDATRERLALAHAQDKEKTLARLRRSLGRGTGHSVSGLREELWEEAHEKRTRYRCWHNPALHETGVR